MQSRVLVGRREGKYPASPVSSDEALQSEELMTGILQPVRGWFDMTPIRVQHGYLRMRVSLE